MDELTCERYPGHVYEYAAERWRMPTELPADAPVTAAVSRRRVDLLLAMREDRREAA